MTVTGSAAPPRFELSRWLFLRLVGVTYVIAFGSLAPQILGLVGSDGLLPAAAYLDGAYEFFGASAYWRFPTLAWLAAGDAALLALCWGGVAVAGLAAAGVAPVLTFALAWALYLSLAVAGQTFLAFQWDTLLLETGLLACLYAPLGWWPGLAGGTRPAAAARWLVWGLAFKLTLLSGVTKLTSGDPTWAGLTALTFHYQTQPLPAWTSWYAHHLPGWLHAASAAGMFAVELAAPFCALLPAQLRRARAAGCAAMCLLQAAIAATGNYGFFNLLTVVLYLALLDDAALGRIVPHALADRAARAAGPRADGAGRDAPRWWRGALAGLAAAIAFVSATAAWREVAPRQWRPDWSGRLLRAVGPVRSINGYGLFRSMTTRRPEIVVEVSLDGAVWREQELRWKPGDPGRRPRFRPAAHAAARLATVVRRARPGGSRALAAGADGQAAGRLAGGDRAARRQPVPRRRRASPVRPARLLPVRLHHARRRGRHRRLVAAGAARLPHGSRPKALNFCRAAIWASAWRALAAVSGSGSKSSASTRCW